MSNYDFRIEADAVYQESALEMQRLYNELLDFLDDQGRRELTDAQEAWSVFAEKQARFSAGLMRGGTGESLLYLQEMNSLTRARVTALHEALRERSA